MPQPPDFDAFRDIRFITNYALHGCAPPWEVIVEFSQEPAADVALLFVGFDPETWFQELFDPGKGRRRRPSRKGRKGLWVGGFPDWNEYGGSRLRRLAGPFPGLALPGFKMLFRIWGGIELFNFTLAVVDGISDVGFETLWGLFQVQPETCRSFERCARTHEGPLFFGGAGPAIWPLNLNVTLYNNGYITQTGFGWFPPNKPNVTVMTTPIYANSPGGLKGALVLYDNDGKILEESSYVDIPQGETTTRELSYDQETGDRISWGWRNDGGFGILFDPAVMGFTTDSGIF